ncbi:Multidrug resistance protein abc superfamily [Globisporangium polare]
MQYISADEEQQDDQPYAALKTPRDEQLILEAIGDTKDVAISCAGSAGARDASSSTCLTILSFAELYRYATPFDKLLVGVGGAMSVVRSVMNPLIAHVLGDILNVFTQLPIDQHAVNQATYNYLAIAVVMFVTEWVAYVTLYHSAERQVKQMRSAALRHMLYLDVSWYDKNDAMQLSTRLTNDTIRIKDGIGVTLGKVIRSVTCCVVGLMIGFAKGWDVVLVASSVVLFVVVGAWLLSKKLLQKAEKSQTLYAEAGAIAEETISAIHTIAALSGEKRAVTMFQEKTKAAELLNMKLARFSAVAFAAITGAVWGIYAIGLWYSGKKVSGGDTDPGSVLTAFVAFLTVADSLDHLQHDILVVAEATGAALALFKMIETKPVIDASSDGKGVVPGSCEGAIEAIDVCFAYPSRPETLVLKNLSVSIASGETVAFVGASGGGKTTLVSLLERFYDPTGGALLLDGRDIKTLNVKWLRSQISLVSREPVLFAASMFENIAAGCDAVTHKQVIRAAKLANAHDFIMSLPGQYADVVGDQEVELSGGQKQSIAIARAIVRQPKILILDEATSALDSESKRAVQKALNNLMAETKTTTLVIAHRLSTIRRADKICVLQDGAIAEVGKHEELMQIEDGIYRDMCKNQKLSGQAEQHEYNGTDGIMYTQRHQLSEELWKVRMQDGNCFEGNDLQERRIGLTDIVRFSKPKWKPIAIGMLSSAFSGLVMPAFAFAMSSAVASITIEYTEFVKTEDRSHLDKMYDDCVAYTLLFLGVAAVGVLLDWLERFCFTVVGNKLVRRLRDLSFRALCKQNVGFFDSKEWARSAFVANLMLDATKVAAFTDGTLAQLTQAVFVIIGTLLVSFLLGSWVLTLVMLAIVPGAVLTEILHYRPTDRDGVVTDQRAESDVQAPLEMLTKIRTIAALGMEEAAAAEYSELLEKPTKKRQIEAHISGLALGFDSFVVTAAMALLLWYGAKLVGDGHITITQMLRTEFAIVMAIGHLGGISSLFDDIAAALHAGSRIATLTKRKVPINAFDSSGLTPMTVNGKIEFRNVEFRYPVRPQVAALRSLNLTINMGEVVAFCGASGDSKNAIALLIERLYDPVCGQVLFDGVDLKDLNVRWLRSQIGFVGNKPSLFVGTIAENIAFGLDTQPSRERIEATAEMVNAHDFISQLPDGYETQLGMISGQLSSGQKQRIAIARAMLEDPAVLILDELTRGLDPESEKAVRDALDKVIALEHHQRTTIIIDSRLSMIQKADKIYVVNSSGTIAEQGTHAELFRANGLYAQLVNAQVLA